jgi:hypothetical protein
MHYHQGKYILYYINHQSINPLTSINHLTSINQTIHINDNMIQQYYHNRLEWAHHTQPIYLSEFVSSKAHVYNMILLQCTQPRL